MAWTVTLNGVTYTQASVEGNKYSDEASGLPAILKDFAAHAAAIKTATSTSSVAIGTGSKSFTVETGKTFVVGENIRVMDAAAPTTNYMEGDITSYDSASGALVVNVTSKGGSGTKVSWTLSAQGAQGAAGPAGVAGPTGVMLQYAGTSAPAGWLLCDGSVVSRATYADLYAVTGDAFGAGDGSTTFGLPDMRGRTSIGLDNMGGTSANRITNTQADSLGGNAGAEDHTITTPESAAHVHNRGANQFATWGTDFYATNSGGSGTNTGSTGGGGAHNNMPPYLAVNIIIKT
ncbi:MAG TPA: hypothetical protein ENI80_03595 [Acidiferrobacteraceae bacterium]|nr:hypothetical protein [Acidiferrobacteraceae bacterium]